MKYFYLFCLFILNVFSQTLVAQTCTVLGQNPGTAFPVCGTSVFQQNDVPICGNRNVPTTCTNAQFSDKNPFWYKFTCYTAGTLGFVITPTNLGDDYDWQLYDVTTKVASVVYSDLTTVIGSNWSGEGGITGASPAGTNRVVCAGPGQPLFSTMPNLIVGHEYLLLISHFTNSQSGYKLEFKGGTANITDPLPPRVGLSVSSCDGTKVGIKLNKKMKCNSLAANGSDFEIFPSNAKVISAISGACSNSFEMDSVVLTLDKTLPPGSYEVRVKKGSDDNTLLDNCLINIPEANSSSFSVFPVIATPMDSLKTPACAPTSLQLVFKTSIRCNSISTSGSEFTVSGPSDVVIRSSTAICDANGLTTGITLNLSQPIELGGIYTLKLQRGNDGNTMINDCNQETPAGSSLQFRIADTVHSGFSYAVLSDCAADRVQFLHNGNNGANSWAWFYKGLPVSSVSSASLIFKDEGPHTVKLVTGNGICRDSSELNLVLPSKLQARFDGPSLVCPTDEVIFVDQSRGPVSQWSWNFGNGNRSTMSAPGPQQFTAGNREVKYRVSLTVSGGGCHDTIVKEITAVNSCIIAVPSAFTPNGDGKNDYLQPSNAWKASALIFRVYNRFGQLIFETRDWTRKWDGRFRGLVQASGTYVWTLQYTLDDTGVSYTTKGTTVLIR